MKRVTLNIDTNTGMWVMSSKNRYLEEQFERAARDISYECRIDNINASNLLAHSFIMKTTFNENDTQEVIVKAIHTASANVVANVTDVTKES